MPNSTVTLCLLYISVHVMELKQFSAIHRCQQHWLTSCMIWMTLSLICHVLDMSWIFHGQHFQGDCNSGNLCTKPLVISLKLAPLISKTQVSFFLWVILRLIYNSKLKFWLVLLALSSKIKSPLLILTSVFLLLLKNAS